LTGTKPLKSVEKTALNVFHDLQLAYAREKDGAPERAARLRISARRNVLEAEEDDLPRFKMGQFAPNSRSAVAESALES